MIRYCRNTPDHNIHETLSEEDLYTAQALKNHSRRSSIGYHQNWIPQRSLTERYDTMTSLNQSNRRVRTRPEAKSFTEAEFAGRRKCSRCGNISARKSSISRRNPCRSQDNPNFSTKTRFGKQAIKPSILEKCINIKNNCDYAAPGNYSLINFN